MNRRKIREIRESLFRLPPWERREQLYQRLEQQRDLAQMTRELLTADQMSLAIACSGYSSLGWGLGGSWTGTAYFETVTNDNPNVWIGDPQTPFPSGTMVSSATANGSWFSQIKPNTLIKRVRFTRLTGSMQVIGAAAIDASWQDAFLAQTTIFNSSKVTAGGTNTLVQTASANSAWNLTFLEVCAQGAQAQGSGTITIYDGTAAGSVLFQEFIPTTGGSIGYTYKCNLPTDGNGNPTLVCTPGNAMTIILSGFGSASTIINTRFQRA